MAVYNIESAEIAHDGLVLHLIATGPVTANWAPLDWLAPFNAGKKKTISSGGKLGFVCASVETSGSTATFYIAYCLHPSSRVPMGASGLTITFDDGVLQDLYGNKLGGCTNFPVTNYSYVDAACKLSPLLVPAAGAPYVKVSNSLGDDSRTLAQAVNLTSPFKTLRRALQAIDDGGYRGVGAHVGIFDNDTETRTSANPYPVINLSGPSVQFPAVVKPIHADGTTATKRTSMSIDKSYGMKREGGGSSAAIVSNLIVSGINAVQTDATAPADPGEGFSFQLRCDNLMLHELRGQRFGSQFLQMHLGSRVSLVRCIGIDGAKPPANPHGMFTNGVRPWFLLSECTWDRNGYYDSAYTKSDLYRRNLYLSYELGAGPIIQVGGWNTRSGSEGAQNRTGGAQFGILGDSNAMTGYVDGAGGRMAFGVECRLRNVLDETSTTIYRRYPGYVNAGAATPAKPCILEMMTVPEPSGAVPAVASPDSPLRGHSFGGKGAGMTHIIRNNFALKCGPMFFDVAVGNEPDNIIRQNNMVDNRGGANKYIHRCIADNWDRGSSYGWVKSDYNGLYNDDPTKIAYHNEPTSADYSLAAWRSKTGTETNSRSDDPPVYPDSTRDLVAWYAFKGGGGGSAGMFAAIRDRELGVWNAWDEWWNASPWIAGGYRATNRPARSAAALDIEGVPVGLPEWGDTSTDSGGDDTGSGDTYKPEVRTLTDQTDALRAYGDVRKWFDTNLSLVTVSAGNQSGTTRRFSIQVTDRLRKPWWHRWLVYVHITDQPGGAPLSSGHTVTPTGTTPVIEAITANAAYILMTDARGLAQFDLALAATGAATRYVYSYVLGRATSSAAFKWI